MAKPYICYQNPVHTIRVGLSIELLYNILSPPLYIPTNFSHSFSLAQTYALRTRTKWDFEYHAMLLSSSLKKVCSSPDSVVRDIALIYGTTP